MYKFFFHQPTNAQYLTLKFFYLLHCYMFRFVRLIFRGSLWILKLLSLLSLRSCTAGISLSSCSIFRCNSVTRVTEWMWFIYRTESSADTDPDTDECTSTHHFIRSAFIAYRLSLRQAFRIVTSLLYTMWCFNFLSFCDICI